MNKIIFSLLIIFSATNILAQNRVAIIIDDIGYARDDIEKLEDVDFPLTTAIFPGYDYSSDLAKEAHELGFEVIIHMPMEAIKSLDPGPGAIYESMSDRQIQDTIDKNIQSVPFCIGINNHMGSKITQDTRCMNIIMSEARKHGLLFIDSLVVKSTVGAEVAKQLGMPVIKRNVFLDNKDNKRYIKNQMLQLIGAANKHGKAIGIGHVNRENTISVIKEMIPMMKEQGIVFCYVSEII